MTDLLSHSPTASAVDHGWLVLDQDCQVWCMLGRHGFTLHDGGWWWGSPRTGPELQVTAAETVAALDLWFASRVWNQTDDCPPAGYQRQRKGWFRRG